MHFTRQRRTDDAQPEIEAAAISAEPLDRLLARLGTQPAGLGAGEVRRRLAQYGPNTAADTKRTPPWLQFLGRFRNPLVIILLVASGMSAVAMAGTALFLPFLPTLPTQVLLNNLLYDLSQIAITFDRVDPEDTAQPTHWDVKLIERFMLVFGPVSSVFDFLTFYALIRLFGAGETLFHTGWFIESLATQVLVVFAIRTRRPLFRSRPQLLLASLAVGIVAVGIALPFAPFGDWLGFVAPPPLFFVYLAVAIAAYLALVEVTKNVFYRYHGARR